MSILRTDSNPVGGIKVLNTVKSISQLKESSVSCITHLSSLGDSIPIKFTDSDVSSLYVENHLPTDDAHSLYIEVSIPADENGTTRASKKLNLSKILNSLNDYLLDLNDRSKGGYLTKEKADELYVPWRKENEKPVEGQIDGPIEIIGDTTGSVLKLTENPSNSTNAFVCGGKSEFAKSIECKDTITTTAFTATSAEITNLTATNCDVGGTLTAANLTATNSTVSSLTADNLTAITELSSLGTFNAGAFNVTEEGSTPTTNIKGTLNVIANGSINVNNGNITLGASGAIKIGTNNNTQIWSQPIGENNYLAMNNVLVGAQTTIAGWTNISKSMTVHTLDVKNMFSAPEIVGTTSVSSPTIIGTTIKTNEANSMVEITDSTGITLSSGIATLTAKAACWS